MVERDRYESRSTFKLTSKVALRKARLPGNGVGPFRIIRGPDKTTILAPVSGSHNYHIINVEL
jgi:hypothetical protein